MPVKSAKLDFEDLDRYAYGEGLDFADLDKYAYGTGQDEFIGPREEGPLSRLSSFAKRAGSNILELMATGRATEVMKEPEPLGFDVFSLFRPPVKEFGVPDPKQQTLAEQVEGVVTGGLGKWREATEPTPMAEVEPYSLEEVDAILSNLAKGISSVPRLAFDIPEQIFLDEGGKPRQGADIAKAAKDVGIEFAKFPLTVFSDYALYLSPLSTAEQRAGAVERIAEHPEGLFFAIAIVKGGLKGAKGFKTAVEKAIKKEKPSPHAARLEAIEEWEIPEARTKPVEPRAVPPSPRAEPPDVFPGLREKVVPEIAPGPVEGVMEAIFGLEKPKAKPKKLKAEGVGEVGIPVNVKKLLEIEKESHGPMLPGVRLDWQTRFDKAIGALTPREHAQYLDLLLPESKIKPTPAPAGKGKAGLTEIDLKATANEMLNDAKYIKAPRVAKGTPAMGVQVDYSASAPKWYTQMRSGTGMGKAETLTGLRAIIKDGAATKNVHGQRLLSYVEEWAQRKPGKGAGEMVAGEFRAGDRVRIGDEWYEAKVSDKTGEVKLIDSQKIEMDVFDKVTVDEYRPVKPSPGKAAGKQPWEIPKGEWLKQHTEGRWTIVGSRVRGTAKPTSDIDFYTSLTVEEAKPLITRDRVGNPTLHPEALPKEVLEKWKEVHSYRGGAKPNDVLIGIPTIEGRLDVLHLTGTVKNPKLRQVGHPMGVVKGEPRGAVPVSQRAAADFDPHTTPLVWHKRIVKQALSEGKLTPEHPRYAEIMAEYPELGKKGKRVRVTRKKVDKITTALETAEQKAYERMRRRGTTLKAGIDPAEIADLAIIGAAKIGRGTIKFAEWSAEMVREFGDRVKPHLKAIYARSQEGTSRFKANAELDSFIDYFEDIQAPKELRPPRKPARAAIRTRLREEGLSGKELTRETDAEFTRAVHDYGIALRTTKAGRIQPAIREAGTYVPEDFATYGKFKDAKAGSFGGTKDVTRFIQEIDGALPGEVKAKLPGGAGPAERYVTWRTRDMLKSRITWTRAMRSRLKLISKGISEKQAKTANQVIGHISREGAYVDPAKLVTNPKISAITTDVNVIRFAQEGRKLYESLLRHQNEFRRLIGRKEIPHRDYYTAHSIHETTIWERALGHDKTPKQVIGPGLPDYIKPNAAFNARAMARELGLPETIREMDLRTLLERYIDTAAKDIYNTAIIQNNKAFIQQLESMGYEHAARGLENWTAEAFAGVKGAADRVASLSANIHKGMRVFRFATLRSVFPFNLKWNVLVQPSSTLMGVSRYGIRNSLKGLYDWTTSKKIRQEIQENAYSAIVKSQRSARMSQQDIVRGVGTAERLNRGKLKTVADYSNFFTDWVERHLTGWSVATAKRHGASIGLKDKALWEYASDGGAKVQSMYNLEDLPGMLRSECIKTGAMFQTFKFEAFNTLREFAGKTGMPPATNAIRVKMVLRFLAGATAINYIGQVTLGRKPWELASFIPFYGQLVSPIVAAVKGEDVPMTTQRGLPVPLGIGIRGVQAAREGLLKPGVAGIKQLIRTGDINEAIGEFMVTGKWDKLRRFTIRYLIAYAGIPGGTQMNRVVDGLIATSVGGMEDSAGKMMFPISGTKEKIRTFLGGPWSTESGQEYWDRRGKELNLDIEFMEENPFLRDVTESIPVFGEFVKFRKDSKSQTRQSIRRMIRTGNTEGAEQKMIEWNMENPDNRISTDWYYKL